MTKINTSSQRGKPAAERFAEKVEPGDGCHHWMSAIGSKGYGIFWVSRERRSVMAHRFAYELSKGRPPGDLLVMHSCDNPRCVNPAHLSLGTNSDNQMDASRKGRNAKGVRNGGGVKLNDDKVAEILASRLGSTHAGRQFGVSKSTVLGIRAGKRWKHVPRSISAEAAAAT